MTLIAASLGVIVLVLLMIRFSIGSRYRRDLKRLQHLTATAPVATFRYELLEGLPLPVQRYFRYALPDGQPYIRTATVRHGGRFRQGLNSSWMRIRGETFFTTSKPGLLWKGQTAFFTAIDSFLWGKGSLSVYLFGLFKIVSGKGYKYSQGELQRWLAESVLFPTNLLPGPTLSWTAVSDDKARMTYTGRRLLLHFLVAFNEHDQITSIKTERYMGNKELKPWTGTLSKYQKINGVRVPTVMKASWRLGEKEFCYADFRIHSIRYDLPLNK